VTTTSGASCSVDEEHPRLLRQRQHCLPLHQPHSVLAHKAYLDRPPLCVGTHGHRLCLRPTCIDDIPVREHLHEWSAYFFVFKVLVQSQHSQWLEF
jgi:hypothetical protein